MAANRVTNRMGIDPESLESLEKFEQRCFMLDIDFKKMLSTAYKAEIEQWFNKNIDRWEYIVSIECSDVLGVMIPWYGDKTIYVDMPNWDIVDLAKCIDIIIKEDGNTDLRLSNCIKKTVEKNKHEYLNVDNGLRCIRTKFGTKLFGVDFEVRSCEAVQKDIFNTSYNDVIKNYDAGITRFQYSDKRMIGQIIAMIEHIIIIYRIYNEWIDEIEADKRSKEPYGEEELLGHLQLEYARHKEHWARNEFGKIAKEFKWAVVNNSEQSKVLYSRIYFVTDTLGTTNNRLTDMWQDRQQNRLDLSKIIYDIGKKVSAMYSLEDIEERLVRLREHYSKLDEPDLEELEIYNGAEGWKKLI